MRDCRAGSDRPGRALTRSVCIPYLGTDLCSQREGRRGCRTGRGDVETLRYYERRGLPTPDPDAQSPSTCAPRGGRAPRRRRCGSAPRRRSTRSTDASARCAGCATNWHASSGARAPRSTTARAAPRTSRVAAPSTAALSLLHVTNGESAGNTLRQTTLGGAVLSWQDVLHDGPVPAAPRPELLRTRARFLAECGWGTSQRSVPRSSAATGSTSTRCATALRSSSGSSTTSKTSCS